MIVGANLPDVDVLAYFGGPATDLAWRRGWTHGVLALAVLLLSFIAILSHPMLDTLNTYGVRWLMPFSGTWFYGDTLFIIDPWVWLVLASGVIYGRRSEVLRRPDPSRRARVALAVVGLYMAAMAFSGGAARAITAREVAELSGKTVENVMAGPAPVDPFVRQFVHPVLGPRHEELSGDAP